jgi:hypothetical protein
MALLDYEYVDKTNRIDRKIAEKERLLQKAWYEKISGLKVDEIPDNHHPRPVGTIVKEK